MNTLDKAVPLLSEDNSGANLLQSSYRQGSVQETPQIRGQEGDKVDYYTSRDNGDYTAVELFWPANQSDSVASDSGRSLVTSATVDYGARPRSPSWTGSSTDPKDEALWKKFDGGYNTTEAKSSTTITTNYYQRALLALYTLGLLLSSVGNSIYFKKMTDAMPNYSWFLSQLTTSVYVPVFFALVFYTSWTGNLAPECSTFPKQRFLVMGGLDSLAGIMMILGGVKTTGTTQIIIQQAVIPITLVATVLILRVRYHGLQYLGAAVIIGGVLIAKSPDFGSGGSSSNAQNDVIFNIIFLLGGVPTALSQVYKEVAFKDADLDTNYLQSWVALFQLFVGFLIVPLNTLPILGPQRLTWREMPSVLINGTTCLLAQHNSITEVIKHGSATLSMLIATLKLPLTSFAFYSTWVMGANAVSPRAADFEGLAVIILGLGFYRYGGVLRRQEMVAERVYDDTEEVPVFSSVIEAEPLFVRVHKARTGNAYHIRAAYYSRLRVASPLDCPTRRSDEAGGRRRRLPAIPYTPASPSHSLLRHLHPSDESNTRHTTFSSGFEPIRLTSLARPIAPDRNRWDVPNPGYQPAGLMEAGYADKTSRDSPREAPADCKTGPLGHQEPMACYPPYVRRLHSVDHSAVYGFRRSSENRPKGDNTEGEPVESTRRKIVQRFESPGSKTRATRGSRFSRARYSSLVENGDESLGSPPNGVYIPGSTYEGDRKKSPGKDSRRLLFGTQRRAFGEPQRTRADSALLEVQDNLLHQRTHTAERT